MDRFHIHKQVCIISFTCVITNFMTAFQTHALADPNYHEDEELLYGTKVCSFTIFEQVAS